MRFLTLLALCFAAVTAVPSHPQKIVGGSIADVGQYPSMAAPLFTWDWLTYWAICGGTIINNRSILSAAHCLEGEPPVRFRIRVGSNWANSGGALHNVIRVLIHPSYNSEMDMNHDIGILRSATTFTYNNYVRAAPIAGTNYNLADNQPIWATGWGDTFYGENLGSEQLRHVQVLSINQQACRKAYDVLEMVITDNMLCSGWPTGGRDQCTGDSGGPVYHNGVLVGVCSFGIGCAQAEFPGINVRVSRYATWIQANA